MPSNAKRLFLIEDNILGMGGHYWEMADLIAAGAIEWSMTPIVATHRSCDSSLKGHFHEIQPAFDVRRMNHWSLGVDGRSWTMRDPRGEPIGGNWSLRQSQTLRDRLARRDRWPARMLRRWSDTLVELIRQWQPGSQDRILINTGDDFVMLAVAAALDRIGTSSPLNVSVLFHFAVHDGDPTDRRAVLFGQQVRRCLESVERHRVDLHATTDALMNQMRQVGIPVTSVPYPTRPWWRLDVADHEPIRNSTGRLKIVMAGLPRPEKGRDWLNPLLTELIRCPQRRESFQVSLQLPDRRWKRMIPAELHGLVTEQMSGGNLQPCDGPIERKNANLSTRDYHVWLDSANIGLFLYEPQRYVARCSGVLLEMMVRGIPVVVPDRCWLADQVREATTDHPIGVIFDNVALIPESLERLSQNYEAFATAARRHALIVRRRHSGAETLSHIIGAGHPETMRIEKAA